MLKITMYSSADKVAGQGVGSAYLELMHLLETNFKDEFDIAVNKYRTSDISHYHTIDLPFWFSTFSKKRGRKIGYVHFLPETLEGSLKIPQPFRGIFYRYVISGWIIWSWLIPHLSTSSWLMAFPVPKLRIFQTLLMILISIQLTR